MASLARHAATRWRMAAAVVAFGLAATVVFVLVYFQPQGGQAAGEAEQLSQAGGGVLAAV